LKELFSNYIKSNEGAMKSLIISGNYDIFTTIEQNYQNNHSNKLQFIDVHFINDSIVAKCFNLKEISFENLDLTQIRCQMLICLNNLNSLSLRCCLISKEWFQINNNNNNMKQIEKLSLIRTGEIDNHVTKDICLIMPNLTSLTINQKESILGDDGVDIIVNNLNNLKQLDLINTSISDNALNTICKSNKFQHNLERLNVSMSSKISNECLKIISENLLNLQVLFLTSCFGISSVKPLQSLSKLTYLNVNNTSIEKVRIGDLNLPKCEIEFGHIKMLTKKSMWTINNSKNCVCSV
jgi:hypothetical protein